MSMNVRKIMKNKSIILLSGGLDSLVALGYSKLFTDYNVKLALTFDYGQKSLEAEVSTSKNIAEYYNIEHKVIKLDWLKTITSTSLVIVFSQSNFITLWSIL